MNDECDENQSYESIPTTFGKYRKIRKIGSGAFSVVILVENEKTKEKMAAKVVSRSRLMSEGIFDRFEQELRLMQSFDHSNIVKVHDVVFTEKLIFLIMEYCTKGELFNYIVQIGVLADFQIKHILKQVADALAYLHKRNIAHRDIKPENILLDAQINAKLADFGLCHQTSTTKMLTTPCGSPFYAPPEIISNEPYDGKKGDMWSLGVVLFTMSTGALPWTEMGQTQLLQQIINADYVIPLTVSPDIRNLIQALMSPNPNSRPSAEDILQLPWLDEFKDEKKIYSRAHSKTMPLSFGPPHAHYHPTNFSIKEPTQSMVHKKTIIIRPSFPGTTKQKMTCSVELAPILGLVRRVPNKIRQQQAKDDSGLK